MRREVVLNIFWQEHPQERGVTGGVGRNWAPLFPHPDLTPNGSPLPANAVRAGRLVNLHRMQTRPFRSFTEQCCSCGSDLIPICSQQLVLVLQCVWGGRRFSNRTRGSHNLLIKNTIIFYCGIINSIMETVISKKWSTATRQLFFMLVDNPPDVFGHYDKNKYIKKIKKKWLNE